MALVTDMGVLGEGGEILQPMLKNRWRVEFSRLGNLINTDSQPLTIQAISVDRPKLSFEEVVLDRYNSRAYIAGKHQFDPINITFESDIGGQVAQLIQEQLESQQRIIGMSAAPRLPAARAGQDYKFAMALRMLDGDDLVLESWYIEGAYVANVDYGDLDYAASETVKITLSVRFDHARQDITGVNGRATGGQFGA